MVVDLRCPECDLWMQANCSKGDLAELDRAQAASREQMVDAYARAVTDSMETLAERLGRALELDLVDADDFAPRRAA
jgi:threonine synthase